MGYTDIVVHLDNARACSLRVDLAIAMAKDFNANLAGYCVIPELDLALYGGAPVSAEIIDAQYRAIEENLAEGQERFRTAVAAAGLDAECSGTIGHPSTTLAECARYADLVIVGQHDPSDPRCTSHSLASELVFKAGGPVMVIPHSPSTPEPAAVPRRVMIAWNGSREAQRAVQDAFALIANAHQVDVVSVFEGDGDDEAAQDAESLCARLTHRGIEASPHIIEAADGGVGQTMVERARDLESDLIVLGGYGHARLTEFLLGGATKTTLAEHDVALIIAH